MRDLTPAQWREVRATFDQIVDLPPEIRTARLRQLSMTDPALRGAVDELLDGDASSDELLERFRVDVVSRESVAERRAVGLARDPLGLTGGMVSRFLVRDLFALGGMGLIYRAHDPLLNRQVALKFLLPHSIQDPSAKERFLREGRAAGQLDHPNLCSIYEVGETEDGQLFLAMALYDGETLKERIERVGALPLATAVDVLRQAALGIGAVHAAGIVHRDLKPANLMLLLDGSVKILDFGLAKVAETDLTRSRTRLGTVAYMAPEQIQGGTVDAGADLWALGVVLYELLTGRRPFEGEEEVAVAHAIVHDDFVPVSTLLPDIPRALEKLLARLLQKDPTRRISSASELAAALAAASLPTKPGLTRGMGRSLTVAARKVRGVTRTTSVRVLMATAVLAIVGTVLAPGAPDLLRASDLTSNPEAQLLYDRGREYEQRVVSPENVNAARGLYERALELDPTFAQARARLALTHVVSYTAGYDRSPARLQQIRTDAEASLQLAPDLPDAHIALGEYWNEMLSHDRALVAFERALRGLPRSVELHAALGRAYRGQGRWDEAIEAFRHALELDPGSLAVIAELGGTFSMLRRYDEAIALYDRIIELEPENYSAKLGKGYMVIRRDGVPDTLAAALERVPPEWDPQGMGTLARWMLARTQRRPQDALQALNAARSDWSGKGALLRHVSLVRAQALEELGDSAGAQAAYRIARAVLEDSAAAYPSDPRWRIPLGLTYAGLKQRSEASREARIVMELVPLSKDAMEGALMMGGAAEILARAGDSEAAIELLDQLLRIPAGPAATVPLLRVDPTWDPLRADPRFEEMLTRHSRH
jgi:serine/threonine-protein kinase